MSTDRQDEAIQEALAQAAPVVRFDGVSVDAGSDASGPRGLSFALAPASFHILTGAPGAGKSAVLRLACLADRPARGLVQVFGRDTATLSVKERPLLRRRIGVVLQDPWFIEHLTVRDNAGIAPRVAGRLVEDYQADVKELLAWMGLARHAGALPASLSPGEARRLALARALANRPELLLVDEPAAGLEPVEAARVLKLLSEIHHAGTTVLMASRDGVLAMRSGYPMLHMQAGRIVLVEPAGRMTAP